MRKDREIVAITLLQKKNYTLAVKLNVLSISDLKLMQSSSGFDIVDL